MECVGLRADLSGLVEAKNGEEAIRHSDGADADLVMTDLVMPEMGGRELIEALRERGCTAPVIVMTGYRPDEVDSRPAGEVAAWVQKPLSLRTVAEVVAKTLNGKSGSNGAASA